MASNDTRFSDLKARLAALNCELLEEEGTHAERYVILDKAKGLIVSNGATIEDQYDWLGCEEEERGKPAREQSEDRTDGEDDDEADLAELDIHDALEKVRMALEFGYATCSVMVSDADLEDVHGKTLYGIDRTLREAATLAEKAHRALYRQQRQTSEPWDARNYQLGDVRSAAQRELLDIFLAIPPEWNNSADGIVMTAFGCYMAFRSATPEVRAEGLELLKRERYVPYVNTFLTLRDKGHVALTAESVPAKGGYAERFKP